MKILKLILISLIVVGLSTSAFAFSSKYTSPNWDMKQGDISEFQKGHQATADYTPNLIVNYDKRHMPWFESTLKPQNLRREGERDLLEDVGSLLSDWFGRKD